MNIANIIKFDTGNARGLSVVVFVSGCTNFCEECHNKETWDFNYGVPLEDKIKDICLALDNSHIKNFVISGGDPLNLKNLDGTTLLLAAVMPIIKQHNQNIILYTGYTLEELQNRIGQDKERTFFILSYIDYLIDGRYNKDKKTKVLDYRGSTNQRCWRRGELGWYDYSAFYFKEETDKNYKEDKT